MTSPKRARLEVADATKREEEKLASVIPGLPLDVSELVQTFLPIESLMALFGTCRPSLQYATSEAFWHHMTGRDFTTSPSRPIAAAASAKLLYQHEHCAERRIRKSVNDMISYCGLSLDAAPVYWGDHEIELRILRPHHPEGAHPEGTFHNIPVTLGCHISKQDLVGVESNVNDGSNEFKASDGGSTQKWLVKLKLQFQVLQEWATIVSQHQELLRNPTDGDMEPRWAKDLPSEEQWIREWPSTILEVDPASERWLQTPYYDNFVRDTMGAVHKLLTQLVVEYVNHHQCGQLAVFCAPPNYGTVLQVVDAHDITLGLVDANLPESWTIERATAEWKAIVVKLVEAWKNGLVLRQEGPKSECKNLTFFMNVASILLTLKITLGRGGMMDVSVDPRDDVAEAVWRDYALKNEVLASADVQPRSESSEMIWRWGNVKTKGNQATLIFTAVLQAVTDLVMSELATKNAQTEILLWPGVPPLWFIDIIYSRLRHVNL